MFLNVLADVLARSYPVVPAMDFYRAIFPSGELDAYREHPADRTDHKYCGIIVRVTSDKKADGSPRIERYTVTDDLDAIDNVLWCDDFCVMSPISYVGKSRKSDNARIMYALVVELDDLIVGKTGAQIGLKNLISQWGDKKHWIPRPTYVAASGNGLHLYYVFDKGIPLFSNVVKSLQAYKHELTTMVWNRQTTTDSEPGKIQYESIFQGFRMVGCRTKAGDRVHAFETGTRVTAQYMNSFIVPEALKRNPDAQISLVYKSDLTLSEARKKYPEWYDKRIVQQQPKGSWVCKRALYDWWLRRIEVEAVVKHRYYCMMALAIYAIKCNIDRAELERDCWRLADVFESRTDRDDNHFTAKDVMDALQCYDDKGLITYPVASIAYKSGLVIAKNKRNYRKQAQHLYLARHRKADLKYLGLLQNDGRPPKRDQVVAWRQSHPGGKKAQCSKDTGLDPKTIRKWWDAV